MEVADVLAARAVEVSFASALSVVASASVADADSSGNSGSNSAGKGSRQGGRHARPHSTQPDSQLSTMLKSQLLDYAPASMGNEERSASGLGMQLLQHSYTINVPGLGHDGGGGGHRGDGVGALDAAVERALHGSPEAAAVPVLRRFSSTSAASRGETAGWWSIGGVAFKSLGCAPGWARCGLSCAPLLQLHLVLTPACLSCMCAGLLLPACSWQHAGQLGQWHTRQLQAGQWCDIPHGPLLPPLCA